MAEFTWEARTRAGEVRRGVMDAENETAVNTGAGLRGGAWDHEASTLGTANRAGTYRYYESSWIGFRVASVVPEPGTGVLVLAGLLGIAGRRRLGEGWPTRRSISAG